MEDLKERNRTKNRIVAAALAISGAVMGYYISIMNSMASPLLDGVYKVQGMARVSALGDLNFYYALGATVSVLATPKLMNIFGRRKLTLILDCCCMVVICLMAVENLVMLMTTRLLMGFFAAANNMLAGIEMIEGLPVKLAALDNIIIYILYTCILLWTFLQQAIFSFEFMVDHWRWFLCYPIVLSLIRFLLLFKFLTFDTPQFIMIKYSDSPDLEKMLRWNLNEVYDDPRTEDHIKELLEGNKPKKEGISFSKLLSAEYRAALISGLIIQIGQPLTGISFFVYFSTDFFNSLSGNGEAVSVFLGLGNLSGGILEAFEVNKVRLITMLKVGVLFQSMFLFGILGLAMANLYSLLPLIVFLYMMSYGMGIGGAANLYTFQILPPEAVGFTFALSWLTSALVGKLSPIGVHLLGNFGMIVVYGTICIVLFLMIHFLCIDHEATFEVKKKEIADPLKQPLKELDNIKEVKADK